MTRDPFLDGFPGGRGDADSSRVSQLEARVSLLNACSFSLLAADGFVSTARSAGFPHAGQGRTNDSQGSRKP